MKLIQQIRRLLFPLFRSQVRKVHDLRTLFIELTTSCNLNCLHCGSDCQKDNSGQTLPKETILSTLRQIRKEHKPSRVFVILSGGEPLCYPGVFSLGKEITNLGFSWGMVTNGFGWSPEKLEKARKAGMASVTVSLDGLEEDHNWMRAHPASFRRAVETIRLLVANPFWEAMDVITCANKRNLKRLPELRKFLIQLGVKQWRIFAISPIGRAKNSPDLFLNAKEYQSLLQTIQRWREEDGIDVTLSESGYLGKTCEFVARNHYFDCRAGINVAGIMVNGDILACPNIDRRFKQGNIFQDSFVEIWENRYQVFRDRRWMKKGECKTCPEWNMCQGNSFHLWDIDKERPKLCHYREFKLGEPLPLVL